MVTLSGGIMDPSMATIRAPRCWKSWDRITSRRSALPSSFMKMNALIRAAALLAAANVFSTEPLREKVNLLEVIKSGAVEYHLNPKMDFHDDPKDVWTFQPD